jgi:hypothetical protein
VIWQTLRRMNQALLRYRCYWEKAEGAYDESLRGIADRRTRSGGGGGGGGGGAEAWNGDGAAKCYKMRVSDGDFAASLWEEDAMRCRTRTQTWL